jgi:H+/gluconate symporter-like permease
VKYNLNPFYGLIIASAIIGLLFFKEKQEVFEVMGQGFGGMLSNIAFIIVFGAVYQ